MTKRIFSALFCATLAVTSMASVNAAEVKGHKGFKDLGEEIYIADNTITGFVYNVEEDYDVRFLFYGEENKPNLVVPNYTLCFKDCLTSPSSVTLSEGEEYCIGFEERKGTGNANSVPYSFDKTGGRYKKVRIKLSEFSDYFNEDGTHTMEVKGENFDYNFTNQGNGYTSRLAILSGVAANGVIPDDNGEVEIFVSTNVSSYSRFFTHFSWKYGGGGSEHGRGLNKLYFGNVDCQYGVDVNDVTTLQLYLAGVNELDTLGLFHADLNGDNAYDVSDVTALQFGIAYK